MNISLENWCNFQQVVKQNATLQTQIREAKNQTNLVQILAAYAQEMGFEFTVNEIADQFAQTLAGISLLGEPMVLGIREWGDGRVSNGDRIIPPSHPPTLLVTFRGSPND